MKLFKRIRLKLGLFTRDEMWEFGAKMAAKKYGNVDITVWHADIENFIHDLKNN